MDIVCINLVYVQVHINMHAPVPDIAGEAVRFVMENIRVVRVGQTMFGAVALVYVIVVSNILVAERDIVREVVHLVVENIRVVTVQLIIVGMAVHVRMYIVMCVRVGIVHQIPEW